MQSEKDAKLSNTSQSESVDINDLSKEAAIDASNNAAENSAQRARIRYISCRF